MTIQRAAWLSVILVLAPVALVGAADSVESAQKTLKDQGLTKRGTIYVLPAEAEFGKGMADIRKLNRELSKSSRDLDSVERKINFAKRVIAHKEFEIRQLNEKLSKTDTVAGQNQLIAKINALTAEVKAIYEGDYKKILEKQNEQNKVFMKSREGYIGAVLKLGQSVDDAKKKYEELEKDPQVKSAVEQINKAIEPRKVTLGPSRPYVAQLSVFEKMRKDILSESIPIEIDGNIPKVHTILNGKVRRKLAVDSGSSLVCLTADLAKDLGLTPSADTPKIRLQLADGKLVEAWQMQLKSIQVGPFTVENVECAVLPESLIAAESMLGNTFLSNFVFKIDLANKTLDLARVESGPRKPQR